MPAPRDDGPDVEGGADRFDIPLVRVGGGRRRRGPSVEQLVALVVVAVAITVIKPWGGDTGRPSAADRPAAVTGSAGSAATAEIPAGPSPTPDPGRALAAEMCLEPSGWRMFATERWSDRLIRSWVLVEPLVGASGPDDPRIPFIDESSMAVLNLGYCAPISGPDRPSSAATATILAKWSAASAPTASGEAPPPTHWDVIQPERVLPTRGASPYGGSWAPPGPGAASWPSGTFVFEIGEPGKATTARHRWFGVIVDLRAPAAH
jgi:hypothetical protein